jgi:hypothetical protein
LRSYVKSLCGITGESNIKFGVQRGLALSPYLLSVVMDEVTKDIQGKIPWCMFFADDIVLVGKNLEEINRLDE